MDNKVLKSSWAIAFTVASIWFGTHVGGGFASGNQVVGYFAQFGSFGSLLFPIISMGLLAWIMSIYLKFARLNGFDNYRDTFAALYPNPKMEFLFEIFYIIIIRIRVRNIAFQPCICLYAYACDDRRRCSAGYGS